MNKFQIIIFIAIIFLIYSCASVRQLCPINMAMGNPGSPVNSELDELNPLMFGDSIIYSVISYYNNYSSLKKISALNTTFSTINSQLSTLRSKLQNYPGAGTLSSFYDNENNVIKIYFSAYNPESKKKNSDIFELDYRNENWSEAKPVAGKINTEYYESHPAISPDGKFMLFASDRPGNMGETDLYISHLNPDRTWSEPENLGNSINTQERELSPFIDSEGNLYFSSQGYSDTIVTRNGISSKDFNIIKATIPTLEKMESVEAGSLKFGSAKVLGEPLNSDYDEMYPLIFSDNIIFSSNRPGGCGGFDIYIFPNCGPAFLQVNINSESSISKVGKLEIVDISPLGKDSIFFKDGTFEQTINEDGTVELPVIAKHEYSIVYSNHCFPDNMFDQKVFIPCSDSTTVKVIVNFELPMIRNEFSFEEYKVPFFVSGYYLPNTTKNLQSLKMKFSYNLLGTNDSTKYIEYPGEQYDQYTPTVEQALSDAFDFIIGQLDYFNSNCIGSSKKLYIEVSGYADPRPISEIAKYDGPLIEPDYSFPNSHTIATPGTDLDKSISEIRAGTQMTNDLLSLLRAYFTAKYLENNLLNNSLYEKYKDKVLWIIEGKGIDTSTETNEQKRRVDIRIRMKNEE